MYDECVVNGVISHDLSQNMIFSHPEKILEQKSLYVFHSERNPAARARGGGHGDVYAACAQNATAHAGGSALRLGCGYAEEAVGTGDAASLESSGRLGCKGKGMDLIIIDMI